MGARARSPQRAAVRRGEKTRDLSSAAIFAALFYSRSIFALTSDLRHLTIPVAQTPLLLPQTGSESFVDHHDSVSAPSTSSLSLLTTKCSPKAVYACLQASEKLSVDMLGQ